MYSSKSVTPVLLELSFASRTQVKLRIEHNIGWGIRGKLVHHLCLSFVGILQARIKVGPLGCRQTLTPEIDQVVVRKYSVVSRRPDIELLIGGVVWLINKLDGVKAIGLRYEAKVLGERILSLHHVVSVS